MRLLKLNKLRRVTSKGDFIPEIDGLRFLAIVPVVLMHANTNYNRVFSDELQIQSQFFEKLINQGGKGVLIFFAISAFILSYHFARHLFLQKKRFAELDLKAYYIRRLTRLEPPFIVSTLILFCFTSIVIASSFSELVPNLIASLTYTHNIIYGVWSPINPVTWSLEVEIQFYLIAPFLAASLFLLKENVRNVLLIFLVIAVPYFVFNEDSGIITNPNLKRTLPVYLNHFLVGILLTSIYTGESWNKIRSKNLIWDMVGALSIFFLFYITLDIKDLSTYYLFDLCLLLMMISVFKSVYINRLLSNPLVTTIGGMCYSIYLIHYAVIFGVSKVIANITFDTPLTNYIVHMIIPLTAVAILSVLFFMLFEKPFMDKNWPSKFKGYVKRMKPE